MCDILLLFYLHLSFDFRRLACPPRLISPAAKTQVPLESGERAGLVFAPDPRQDKWEERRGEMDGAYFPEQTENDDGSGMPMRSLSGNNLHISIDSFK